MEPQHDAGVGVTGSFEGWYKNDDGTFSLLVGYYNRNRRQELDIPVGPNNRMEPGGPDRGQPTHFMPGRNWGVFAVKVPADFGEGKITWTISANGMTTTIPLNIKPDWEISPFAEISLGNTPPVVKLEENGKTAQGPRDFAVERTAKVGAPLALNAWVTDDAKYTSNSGARPRTMPPAVTMRWTKYRGPGPVVFSSERPTVEGSLGESGFVGKNAITATFSQPGDYVLHLVVNDYSGPGGAGFQCCWTNAQVKVKVQ